ncbi:THAP domain-containing protein 1 isoform X2 [Brachyhypopomus gauderio]
MKRSNFKPTKYSNICSQHFTKDCFKRECNNRVLKENAVPSLFSFNKLHMKTETDFPLNRSNPDAQEAEILHASDPAPTLTSVPTLALSPTAILGEENPEHQPSAFISCDHNYTAEDTVQQKKRIEQLEEQLERLRKKLKTVRQKCRRQERQLERLRAAGELPRAGKGLPLGESYVILPKELFNVLKIDTIDGL